MVKKYIVSKITVCLMCLFLIFLFCLFPTNEVVFEDKKYNNEYVVYLLDKDNYLSKVTYFYDSLSLEDEVRDKINRLINGIDTFDIFYPLIPKNTKINDINISKDNIYIDFSSDLLNVSKPMEEIMIESIIYTLSEINGINNIYLSVDGNDLLSLPSGISLPYPLTREFGINKEYYIDSFDNINKTIVVFSKEYDDFKYNVPVTIVNNDSDDKINIIIEELKSSFHSQNNLNGFINDKLELIEYNINDDNIELVFNEYIFSNSEENIVLDDVKMVISESIFENYDVDKVILSTLNTKNIVKIEENT